MDTYRPTTMQLLLLLRSDTIKTQHSRSRLYANCVVAVTQIQFANSSLRSTADAATHTAMRVSVQWQRRSLQSGIKRLQW